ncbi:MAG: COX15/CtaA family protein [Methylovirgula sp.]|nr:COX15/CtaA family protein [Methylovirgula sp.]
MSVLTSTNSAAAKAVPSYSRAIQIWLWIVAALIFTMVVVGGATRLTESGLSITEWHPISGVIPPLSYEAWIAEFDKFKQIPQYKAIFSNLDLNGFKFIFFWEWSHRLLGRVIGLAVALPLVFFWVRGALTRDLKFKLVGLLTLGGLQGFVGWWMVSSGLVNRIEVAQERLATHLLLASITFAATVWIASSLAPSNAVRSERWQRFFAGAIVLVTLLQIFLGALVAGLRAGRAYNTWPLMDGHFVPDVLMLLQPWWRNFVDNIATVQFQHRMVAYTLLALAIVQAIVTWRAAPGSRAARRSLHFAGLVTLQAALGIVTLLLVVPLWAGLVHQAFAMLVLLASVRYLQGLEAGKQNALARP